MTEIVSAIDQEIARLRQARALLASIGTIEIQAPATAAKPARKKMSQAARKKIAATQRKRWAAHKAAM